MTEVASHAGCRLPGAQTWVAVVPRRLPPHSPHPPTSDMLVPEHGLSVNSQHRASVRRDIRPTGLDPETIRAGALLRQGPHW